MIVQNSACFQFVKKQDFIWYRKISASNVYISTKDQFLDHLIIVRIV